MISNQRFERIRKSAAYLSWGYFVFMAYMLLNPQPPVDFIPEYTFSWIHFLAFALQGVLVGLARRKTPTFVCLALLWCWGAGSEFLQPYTGRCFEVCDIIQDVLGSTAGLLPTWFLRRVLVERPEKAHKLRSGAVAILFRPPFSLSDDAPLDLARRQVLVIRRSANVAAPGALCFPGGGIEQGETPADAVVREFREEVGVEIRVGGVIAENTTPVGAPLFWFVAELATRSDSDPVLKLQRSEVAGYEWRTLEELLEDPDFLPNNLTIVRKIVGGEISLRG